MNGNTKVRLVAVVGATALAAIAVPASSFAGSVKPKPACQSVLVTFDGQRADGSGLQLYTWTACGRRVGIPFG